ncbi:LAG1 longevity assurance-like protein 2 [Bienertia sinuspersici]
MESFLKSSNRPEAWHFLIAIYFSIFFVGARFFFDKFVFRRLAIWLLSKGRAAPLKFDEATQAKIIKCSESLWKLTYYATVEASILRISYDEPWFSDTKEYFREWPNQELKLPLELFYMCQCGFYIYSIAALLTWETRRKDFAVMMSHHVITVLLICYSYVTGY